MTGRREVRIQTALLLILLPTLFLTAAGAAYLMYSSLYREILSGFDARLRAVSTITGGFIDGEKHAAILRGFQPAALAADLEGSSIYAVDAEGNLLKVGPETGSAALLGRLPARFADLTWDEPNRQLLGLEEETGWLYRIDPGRVGIERLVRVPGRVRGIAWESTTGRLYAAGDFLVEIDPKDFRARQVASLKDLQVNSLSSGPENGTLLGLTASPPSKLVEIRVPQGLVKRVSSLLPAETGGDSEGLPAASVEEDPLKALQISGLAYDGRKGSFWAAGSSLGILTPDDGRFAPAGYPGYRDENGALYQTYIRPMRRIKEAVGLTYLYTFVLGPKDQEIIYVLDANLDDDHSRIGDIDADPPEPGTIRVHRDGGVNLSEIEFWEQWGLIKSADAPIFSEDGTITALAGADINVSVIEEKTESALLTVLLSGLFCVLIASVAVVKVSNSLLRPIEELKNQALKVAAGDFGQRVTVDRPAELRQLAESFNEMSAVLKGTVDGLAQSNRELERDRQRAELVLTIAKRTDCALPNEYSTVLCGRATERAVRRDASGWIVHGQQLYFWFVKENPDDPFDAVRLRSDLSALLSALVEKQQGSWREIEDFLEPLFQGVVGSVLNLDMERLTLRGMVRDPLLVYLVSREGGNRALELAGDVRLEPRPGEQAFLAGPVVAASLGNLDGQIQSGRFLDRKGIQEQLGRLAQGGHPPKTDHLLVTFWRES